MITTIQLIGVTKGTVVLGDPQKPDIDITLDREYLVRGKQKPKTRHTRGMYIGVMNDKGLRKYLSPKNFKIKP